MNTTARAVLMIVLLLLVPTFLTAQVTQSDPVIAQLQDSIKRLNELRDRQQNAMEGTQLPIPDVENIVPQVFDDRAYFDVHLNDIGRLRFTVTNVRDGGRREYFSDDFVKHHRIAIANLIAGERYTAEARVLQHNAAKTPSPTNFRTGEAGQRYHSALAFTAATATAPPTPTIVGGVRVSGTTAQVTVNTPVRALVQGRVYGSDGNGAIDTTKIVESDGDVLTTDAVGRPGSTTGMDRNTTLRFTGLNENTRYYFMIEALAESGRRVTLPTPGSFNTQTNPTDFGFSGPVNIRVNPATGLVIQWNSTTPADSGKVSLQGATGGAWQNANLTNDGKTMTVTVPQATLLSQGVGSTITVDMKTRGGNTRRNLSFTIGIEEPTAAQIAATGSNRTRVEDVVQAFKGTDTSVNWNHIMNTGLKIFLRAVPAAAGFLGAGGS